MSVAPIMMGINRYPNTPIVIGIIVKKIIINA